MAKLRLVRKHSLTELTPLHFGGNQLTGIPSLCLLANLTVINLDDNQIQDISVLSGLTSLGDRPDNAEYREGVPIHLALQNNRLSDIAPLVSNIGLDDEDGIDLPDKPLSEESLGRISASSRRVASRCFSRATATSGPHCVWCRVGENGRAILAGVGLGLAQEASLPGLSPVGELPKQVVGGILGHLAGRFP